jgi:RHS repeat-associated protein
LIRKAYFFEKSAANTPVFAAMLIHMNGRIYDPHLGRMLQADPFIQFPTNTQSYNRYSYVLNNPLSYTDPSGYFLKELLNVVVDIGQMVYGGEVISPQAWANLAKDVYLLAEALNEEFKSNPSSMSFQAGVAPGAFSNQLGPVQAGSGGAANRGNPYPWDPTAGSIIGATYSDQSGNFANGAATRSFSIMLLGQPKEKQRREGAQKEKTSSINYKARAISGTAPMGGGFIDVEFEMLSADGKSTVNFSGSVLTTNMGVGLDLSFVESEGVLTGPYIPWAKSAVMDALNGQTVTGDGFTFSIGNGIVFGGDFDIGPYTDPDSVFQVKGISIGWEGFRGTLNIDPDSFDVTRNR